MNLLEANIELEVLTERMRDLEQERIGLVYQIEQGCKDARYELSGNAVRARTLRKLARRLFERVQAMPMGAPS